jgi:hypothetical protein
MSTDLEKLRQLADGAMRHARGDGEYWRYWKPVYPGLLVFGTGLIGGVIGMATGMEPLVSTFANLVGRPAEPMERKAPVKGFPADVASYAYAQCGYCVDTCTLDQVRGWESCGPRGKWSFLKASWMARTSSTKR